MTIEEAINKLKEDYTLRSMLKKKNLNVQDELEDEIEDLEQSVITSKIIPELEKYAKELLQYLECEVYLGIMKDANGEVRVGNEYVSDEGVALKTLIDTYGPATKNEIVLQRGFDLREINKENINDAQGRDLRITVDGVSFQEKNAIQTFISALQHIGLDKVAKVGIICSGYNLVDARKRTDGNRKWQQQVEGKWIYIYFSNPTKCKYLFQIADYLHKNIKIEAI